MSDILKRNPDEQPEEQSILRDPTREVAAAGDQALKEVKDSIRQPQIRSSGQDLVFYDPNTEVTKGNQYTSGGWLHGPAHFEMFANTDERLTRISAQLGAPVTIVQRVRGLRVKGTRLVYLWPTHDEDPKGMEIKRYDSSAWVNLIKLLKPAGIFVQTGYKERYQAHYAEPTDHVYPALKIDFSKPEERVRDDRRSKKKKKQEEGAQGQDQTQSQAQEQAQDQTQQPQPQAQSEIQPTPPPALPHIDPDLEDEMEE